MNFENILRKNLKIYFKKFNEYFFEIYITLTQIHIQV